MTIAHSSPLALPDVLKKIHALPSLPAVVLELLASLDQEEVNLDLLARKISLDQALTAKTLRLANSSFYGMQRQVTTISEAIAILGLQSVRNLATTAALVGSLGGDVADTFDFMAFWRHAIGTALCARSLAVQLGLNYEQAYIAGLLHDIGRLVLATQFTKPYAAAMAWRDAHQRSQDQQDDVASSMSDIRAEQAVLGLDHAAVGEALARHWKFPDPIRQAIAHHHASDAPAMSAMARVIHVADTLAHALESPLRAGAVAMQIPTVPQAIEQQLGLTDAMLLAVLQDADGQFDGACSVLAK